MFGLWCAVPAHQYGVGIADEDEVETASSGHVPTGRIVGSPLFAMSARCRYQEACVDMTSAHSLITIFVKCLLGEHVPRHDPAQHHRLGCYM